MSAFIFSCLLFISQSNDQSHIPFKAEKEFTVRFDLSFGKRGSANPHEAWPKSLPEDDSPLPRIKATLKVLTQLPEEAKLIIVRNNVEQSFKKKLRTGMEVMIFSEFVDDIKAELSAHSYTVYFLNTTGTPVSRVIIEFDDEGFYRVNGIKKGKL